MIYYLSLGSNLGNRLKNLQNAVQALAKKNMKPVYFSAIYETSYVGDFGKQPDYLNATIGINCCLQPTEIVDRALNIETELGRKKSDRNGSRIIDIDLLLCGKIVSKEKKAIVPHPRLHERLFVLTPLREIAAKEVHPVLNKTIEALYIECLKKSREKIKLFAPAFKLEN